MKCMSGCEHFSPHGEVQTQNLDPQLRLISRFLDQKFTDLNSDPQTARKTAENQQLPAALALHWPLIGSPLAYGEALPGFVADQPDCAGSPATEHYEPRRLNQLQLQRTLDHG